ncbi:hypothetical protein HFN_1939 [Helicobacter fennelliae MRY12-0050]|uniref:Uncharacterized protein n=1 Tax=Helicobacter fennelliae MRY12-0050 TaxID=1325130 RepID=T1CZH4_9HELI|nr:hypothetical protein HFN_1939 [Helicobacter fennelliae MRY12-0050]
MILIHFGLKFSKVIAFWNYFGIKQNLESMQTQESIKKF